MNKGFVVRASKFRHVFGKSVKKEEHYENVQSNASAPDSNLVDASPRYFAVPWRGGGGPFVVWPLNKTGRLPQDVPMCTGHGGPIMDLQFSPFCGDGDQIIASASDDTTTKIWKVPSEGLEKDLDEAAATLSGHYKKVILVRWNPIANNVIATVSFDNTIKLWDVESGKEKGSFGDHPDAIQSFDWNFNGSRYATYCKDKQARIIDPRNNETVNTYGGHQGTKAARFSWLGDRPMFCTIGFSKQSERQIFFWDERDCSKPLSEVQIDIASGTLLPFFDPDTSLLYLAGKGDTNIRYFEIEDTDPFQYYLAQFLGKDPQRGLCMVPKRGLDVDKCEITRFLRLSQNAIEPVSFSVPRKGDQFQSDIYPDTFAGKCSLSGADWFNGANAGPMMKSMNPADSTVRPVVKGSSQT
eukprot:CAMPEP_0181309598 /NCGR_PEP_ID=MMETSP1101-20121128/12098_1 /TAXON_ID=46948 /ORGANISM="Rhodomonas abbreviata, Strain Caron Lab Isolate" /LENGTH=410 /DNA_ID=CAMNT_0023416091 /DNA_START=185 /DNA_END=1413 /DNA_ORIENTATION=+